MYTSTQKSLQKTFNYSMMSCVFFVEFSMKACLTLFFINIILLKAAKGIFAYLIKVLKLNSFNSLVKTFESVFHLKSCETSMECL